PCRSVRRHRSPLFLFLFHVLRPPLPLHSFPTRRSSDLPFFAAMVVLLADHDGPGVLATYLPALEREYAFWMDGAESLAPGAAHRDRKSTRLNSSHVKISYAVFCLKKKKKEKAI